MWIANGILIRGAVFTILSTEHEVKIMASIEEVLTQEKQMRLSRPPATYATLQGSIIRETEKAIRFMIETPGHCLDGETFWFPFSQLRAITRSHSQELDEIQVPDWLIEAKVNDLAKENGD